MGEFARYKIVDYYEDTPEILGITNIGKEAYNLFAQRVLDTDGECSLTYFPVDTVDIEFEAVLKCALKIVWLCFNDDCLDIED